MGNAYSMLANTIDYGEWKFGIRNDGLVYSGGSFSAILGSGIASRGIGWIQCNYSTDYCSLYITNPIYLRPNHFECIISFFITTLHPGENIPIDNKRSFFAH